MIDVKELRIGNTIENCFGQIVMVNKLHISIDLKRHGPIPITEDWLLKFGLKYHTDGDYYYTKDELHLYLSPISGKCEVENISSFDLSIHDIKISYIHQLQNLYFALTGKELTFKHTT